MNEQEFFSAVLRGLRIPPSAKRLRMLAEWHRREGMPLEETWNPLATTWWFDGQPTLSSQNIGYGPGNWNSVPVRIYATPQDGIYATVATLAQDYYTNIIRCLRDETGYEAAIPEFATYVGSWAYGQELVQAWQAIGQEGGGTPSMDEIDLNTALEMRFDLLKLAGSELEVVVAVHRYLAQAGSVPPRG